MNKNRILLVTKAVHEVPGARLLNLLWELREIDHMAVSSDRLMRCETRFRGTFTKLKVLDPDLLDFDKVLLLDIDTVVLRNCDEVFAYQTPAAVPRGNYFADPGSTRDSKTLFNRYGVANGGINAGVMLLSPSKEDFRRCQMELEQSSDAASAPEQAYLSHFYDDWHKLPVKYNWQPQQMMYLDGRFPPNAECERRLPIDEVCIVHYSGTQGPHNFLFDVGLHWSPAIASEGFENFLKQVLMPYYEKDRKASSGDLALMSDSASRWMQAHKYVAMTLNKQQKPASN